MNATPIISLPLARAVVMLHRSPIPRPPQGAKRELGDRPQSTNVIAMFFPANLPLGRRDKDLQKASLLLIGYMTNNHSSRCRVTYSGFSWYNQCPALTMRVIAVSALNPYNQAQTRFEKDHAK
jgi:hypothetical protein